MPCPGSSEFRRKATFFLYGQKEGKEPFKKKTLSRKGFSP